MTYLSNRDIEAMGSDARKGRLVELREEMLQLRAEQSLGGNPSNPGAYKATRRSIARLLTHMKE